jgi:putative nucleotidyltransferase with HDIG domain
MSLHPNLEEQEALAETFRRDVDRMSRRELRGEIVVGVGFAAALACLWALHPPHAFAIAPAAFCLIVFVASTRVWIDTPFGFAPPTQLAFVPLVFALPLAVVPIAVIVALAISRLPAVLRGEVRGTRLLVSAGNSWFALGPVAVFTVAGVSPRAAGAGVLIGALAAQFAVDFVISAVRIDARFGARLSAQVRTTWVYVIDAGLSGVAFIVARNVRAEPATVLVLLPLIGLLAMFARERHQRLVGLLELNSAYRGTALVLGDVVEADDGYTGEHCKSVLGLALAVAERLGLDAARRRNLEFGALLHDVGKIAIPNDIINKPGTLDPDEWTVIKTHTIEGQKMLDRVGGFMREVGLIVRSHHEHWDGGGYPDGLSGEQIPLESRIIACCDAWNAMRTDRAYRKALSHEVAMTELLNNIGSQFDPTVAAELISIVESEGYAEGPGRAGVTVRETPSHRHVVTGTNGA